MFIFQRGKVPEHNDTLSVRNNYVDWFEAARSDEAWFTTYVAFFNVTAVVVSLGIQMTEVEPHKDHRCHMQADEEANGVRL